MGFFSTQDGKDVRQTSTGSFEAGGGSLEPIPKDTKVKAVIDEINWSSVPEEAENDAGVGYINVRYNVLAPEDYKGRKIFQKLFVTAAGKPSAKDAQKKRDSDITLLAAINVNSNTQPLNNCQAAPTDGELYGLNGTILLLQLDVWEVRDRKGNWVRSLEGATATRATATRKPAAAKPAATAQPATAQPQQPVATAQPAQQQPLQPDAVAETGTVQDDIDDEITF